MKTLCALSCFAVALFACQPPRDGEEEPALDADEVPEQYRESALTAVKVRIQAEDYLPGGEGVGYHDNTPGNTGGSYRQDDVDIQPTGDVGGGFNVGWVGDGEYLVYALNVPSPGRVTLTARVASARTELKRVHAEVDGRALPAVSFSDSAGWQVYRDLPLGSVDLDSGKHTLRIVADVGLFNLNHVDAHVSPACTVTSKLVNTCRPWLGAWASQSPDAASDPTSQLLKHEERIGRQVDIVHSYHPVGSRPLSAYERQFIARPNTTMFINWKPAARWADADGRSASVNATIDATADALKSVAPKKVLLAVFHEPENNVSSGVSCVTLKPETAAGSPADYRAMWKNVRARFAARGVTNVVFVWNVMGYQGWACMMKDLYPGDELVDWVMWDPYIRGSNDSFDNSISYFYRWMENNTDATHSFTSKAWGLAEWGTWDSDQPTAYRAFDDAKKAMEAGTFPRLNALVIFDARSGSRIAYSLAGAYDPVEVQHYRAFAQSAAFKNP